MFVSSTVIKTIVGVSSVGGLAAAGFYGVFNEINSQIPRINSIVVVSTQSDSVPTSPAQLTHQDKTQDYKCKIINTTDEAISCKLVKLNIQNNWIDLTGIKNSKQTGPLSTSDLNKPGNYFKLEVDATFFSKVDVLKNQPISIISSTKAQTPFATLNTLFKLDNSGVYYDKTPHLLGRATTPVTPVASEDKFECPFTNSTDSATHKSCSFYPFGTTVSSLSGAGYSNQNATNLLQTKVSSSLEADKYYVVEYTTPLDKATIANNHKVWINKVPTSGTNTATTSLNNVVPAIVIGASGSKTAFILSETPSFSVVVEKTDSIAAGKQLTHNQTTKNYKCKLANATSVDCSIVPIAFTNTKTSLNITDIKNATLSDGQLTTIPTAPTKVYYKVEVNSAFFANFKDALSTKSIEVVDSTASASEARILTLQPILAIDDNNDAYFDKSVFIVDKATVSSPASLTAGQVRYCSFTTNASAAGSDAKKCHITDLGASIPAAQDFIKSTTEAQEITASNHYLVHFVEASDEHGFPKTAKTTSSSFYVEQATANTSDAKTKIATFPNANIHPAIIVDSATAGKKNAFILKTN